MSKLDRDLSRTVIVDNTPKNYSLNKENGIPIKSFFDDMSDRELDKLKEFLIELAKVEDVRPILHECVTHSEDGQKDSINLAKGI